MSLLLWTLFFVIWLWSSPWGWDCFCPAISRMNCIFHHIFFMYVWSYVAYLLSFSFFHICLYVIFLYVIFHFFHFYFCIFWEIQAKLYTWTIYRDIIYYCVIFCQHILLYRFFVLSWDIFSVSAHLFLLSS